MRRAASHNIGLAEPVVCLREQASDCGRFRGIDGESLGTSLAGQRGQLLHVARRQPDAKAGRCEPLRE